MLSEVTRTACRRWSPLVCVRGLRHIAASGGVANGAPPLRVTEVEGDDRVLGPLVQDPEEVSDDKAARNSTDEGGPNRDACDPLSSQGILMAMVMGERAATVIRNHLAGDRQSFVSYTAFVEQMYTTFLANRAACYAAEPRWTKSPFWRRRFPVDPLSM